MGCELCCARQCAVGSLTACSPCSINELRLFIPNTIARGPNDNCNSTRRFVRIQNRRELMNIRLTNWLVGASTSVVDRIPWVWGDDLEWLWGHTRWAGGCDCVNANSPLTYSYATCVHMEPIVLAARDFTSTLPKRNIEIWELEVERQLVNSDADEGHRWLKVRWWLLSESIKGYQAPTLWYSSERVSKYYFKSKSALWQW